MEIAYLYGGLGIIVLLLDLWALASVWRTTKSFGLKVGWTALILVLPVIGLVVWGIAGPRGVANPPSSPNHSKG